ncbi:MAG: class E sortase, partial [Actinobacteria bacterium]
EANVQVAEVGATRETGWRPAARWLGTLLLGVAVGLLGYVAVTDVIGRFEQQQLRRSQPMLSEDRAVAPAPETTTGPVFDFAGWASQDRKYWRELPEGGAFGRLRAPKMGLDAVVVKGTTRQDLARGPGWIVTTDLPGPTGNCGISGHRTTYGAPFRHLDRLKPGDTITFDSPYRRYTYRVRRVFAVTPDHVEVVAHTKDPQLTLTACHPPYSARFRLIVSSDLVEVRQLER